MTARKAQHEVTLNVPRTAGVAEVARLLDRSQQWVRDQLDRGNFKGYQHEPRGKIDVDLDSVETYMTRPYVPPRETGLLDWGRGKSPAQYRAEAEWTADRRSANKMREALENDRRPILILPDDDERQQQADDDDVAGDVADDDYVTLVDDGHDGTASADEIPVVNAEDVHTAVTPEPVDDKDAPVGGIIAPLGQPVTGDGGGSGADDDENRKRPQRRYVLKASTGKK